MCYMLYICQKKIKITTTTHTSPCMKALHIEIFAFLSFLEVAYIDPIPNPTMFILYMCKEKLLWYVCVQLNFTK